jgi:5'-nucleotidase
VEPFIANSSNGNPEGGLARISGMVKKIRSENPDVLLFDAGDMFQGTPYYNYYKGELILKLMTEIGYDGGAIGNHEFDDGMDNILKSLTHAGFPIINSNYDFSDTILADRFPRFKIYKKSGVRIGVYGLGIELNGLVADKNYGNTIYNDPLKTAIEMESFLKNDKDCDLVICLSHLGFKYRENRVSDHVIAAETSMTDLIIGGHSHTYLQKPVEMKNKAGKQVIINQASWGGLMLGRVDFVFEKSRKKNQVVTVENIKS